MNPLTLTLKIGDQVIDHRRAVNPRGVIVGFGPTANVMAQFGQGKPKQYSGSYIWAYCAVHPAPEK